MLKFSNLNVRNRQVYSAIGLPEPYYDSAIESDCGSDDDFWQNIKLILVMPLHYHNDAFFCNNIVSKLSQRQELFYFIILLSTLEYDTCEYETWKLTLNY